jgi:hypothetical protein
MIHCGHGRRSTETRDEQPAVDFQIEFHAPAFLSVTILHRFVAMAFCETRHHALYTWFTSFDCCTPRRDFVSDCSVKHRP